MGSQTLLSGAFSRLDIGTELLQVCRSRRAPLRASLLHCRGTTTDPRTHYCATHRWKKGEPAVSLLGSMLVQRKEATACYPLRRLIRDGLDAQTSLNASRFDGSRHRRLFHFVGRHIKTATSNRENHRGRPCSSRSANYSANSNCHLAFPP